MTVALNINFAQLLSVFYMVSLTNKNKMFLKKSLDKSFSSFIAPFGIFRIKKDVELCVPLGP
jgi:hypothetical protein